MYEGLTIGEHTPSTDNDVESINGKIKLLHTLRERLAVNSYLVNAYDMLRNCSKDILSHKVFNTTYNVGSETWKMAYDYLHSADSLIKRTNKKSNLFILTKKEDESFLNSDFINKNYDKIKNLNFNILVDYMTILLILILMNGPLLSVVAGII
ncbi:unnamed protein product [Brachionus calyciflorus]|uniref:Uncharacterized protein n=1 Tax=Brachionus calyciflorus TaxID=104777 RepID=A0A813M0R0_9BILA|nr:unnamed protein product [Brachionus calyciflorus]